MNSNNIEKEKRKIKAIKILNLSTGEIKIVKETNKYFKWYKRCLTYKVLKKFEV